MCTNQVSTILVANFSDPTFFPFKKLSYATTNVPELTQFTGVGRGYCSFDQLSVVAREIFSELCPIWAPGLRAAKRHVTSKNGSDSVGAIVLRSTEVQMSYLIG